MFLDNLNIMKKAYEQLNENIEDSPEIRFTLTCCDDRIVTNEGTLKGVPVCRLPIEYLEEMIDSEPQNQTEVIALEQVYAGLCSILYVEVFTNGVYDLMDGKITPEEYFEIDNKNQGAYIIEFEGDIEAHHKIYAAPEILIALDILKELWPKLEERGKDKNWAEREDADEYGPSLTNDKVIIWAVMPSGFRRVIWRFCGESWLEDTYGIPQGKLIGHKESLYKYLHDLENPS